MTPLQGNRLPQKMPQNMNFQRHCSGNCFCWFQDVDPLWQELDTWTASFWRATRESPSDFRFNRCEDRVRMALVPSWKIELQGFLKNCCSLALPTYGKGILSFQIFPTTLQRGHACSQEGTARSDLASLAKKGKLPGWECHPKCQRKTPRHQEEHEILRPSNTQASESRSAAPSGPRAPELQDESFWEDNHPPPKKLPWLAERFELENSCLQSDLHW